jgi:hypothetical protein
MGGHSRVMGPASGTNQAQNWSIFLKAREVRNITNSSIIPEDESEKKGGACE